MTEFVAADDPKGKASLLEVEKHRKSELDFPYQVDVAGVAPAVAWGGGGKLLLFKLQCEGKQLLLRHRG